MGPGAAIFTLKIFCKAKAYYSVFSTKLIKHKWLLSIVLMNDRPFHKCLRHHGAVNASRSVRVLSSALFQLLRFPRLKPVLMGLTDVKPNECNSFQPRWLWWAGIDTRGMHFSRKCSVTMYFNVCLHFICVITYTYLHIALIFNQKAL